MFQMPSPGHLGIRQATNDKQQAQLNCSCWQQWKASCVQAYLMSDSSMSSTWTIAYVQVDSDLHSSHDVEPHAFHHTLKHA